ncbi:hypothetical protein FQR65_LT00011 [Abscondita terminalis]|nr:hypothetical protein FQR65_LT00011 [Abscondita terminalis]
MNYNDGHNNDPPLSQEKPQEDCFERFQTKLNREEKEREIENNLSENDDAHKPHSAEATDVVMERMFMQLNSNDTKKQYEPRSFHIMPDLRNSIKQCNGEKPGIGCKT